MTQVFQFYPGKKRSLFDFLSLTNKLIILNVLIYFISLFVLGFYGEEFFSKYLALTPALVLQSKSIWTFFTSMFLHGSFFHLFANMFSLFFIGNFLEKLIGRKRFFWIYLLSGLLGGVFFVIGALWFGNVAIPAVGASGAIFGLLGVLAILVPFSKIYLIVGPLILLLVEVVLMRIIPSGLASFVSLIINILFFMMIFSMLSFNSSYRKLAMPIELPMWFLPIVAILPLMILSYFVELPIGNSAHLGGLVAGLFYGFYLRRKFPRKTLWLSRRFR